MIVMYGPESALLVIVTSIHCMVQNQPQYMISGNMQSFNGPESALLHVMVSGNMHRQSLYGPESALLVMKTSSHCRVQNQHM